MGDTDVKSIIDGRYVGNALGFVKEILAHPDGSYTLDLRFPAGLPDEFVDAVAVEAAIQFQNIHIAAGGSGLEVRSVGVGRGDA